MQLNKAIEKGNSDLIAKRKDDKYKKEIEDAANGKPASPNVKVPVTLEDAKEGAKEKEEKEEKDKEDKKAD